MPPYKKIIGKFQNENGLDYPQAVFVKYGIINPLINNLKL